MKKIKIDGCEIILENLGINQGKIIINSHLGNYSYYWGSMGNTIEDFLMGIDSGYFSNKLSNNEYSFSKKKTFKALRTYIKNEIFGSYGWYSHMNFQKDMRIKINDFLNFVGTNNEFVYGWNSFLNSLDFMLIEHKLDRDHIEEHFNSICEVWNFIEVESSQESIFLMGLHKKIIKALKKNKYEVFEKTY